MFLQNREKLKGESLEKRDYKKQKEVAISDLEK